MAHKDIMHSTVLTARQNARGKLLAPTRSTLCGKGKDAKMTTEMPDVTCKDCLSRLTTTPEETARLATLVQAVTEQRAAEAPHATAMGSLVLPALRACVHERVIRTIDRMFPYRCLTCDTQLTKGTLPEPVTIMGETPTAESFQNQADDSKTERQETITADFLACAHDFLHAIDEAPFNYRCADCGTLLAGKPFYSGVLEADHVDVQEAQDAVVEPERQDAEGTSNIEPEGERARLVPTWTTASASFDLSDTQEIQEDCGLSRGLTVRQVATPLWHVHGQRSAYVSARHAALGEREWQRHASAYATALPRGAAPQADVQGRDLVTGERHAEPSQPAGPLRPPSWAPHAQRLRDLVAQGEDAVLTALASGRLVWQEPGEPGGPAQKPRKSSRPLGVTGTKILDAVPTDVQAQMRADRGAGMSFVKIDLKHGYLDAVQTRGRVSWTVCKATPAPQEGD